MAMEKIVAVVNTASVTEYKMSKFSSAVQLRKLSML